MVPGGRVRRSHLVLCKNCAYVGHVQDECRKAPADSYRVQEMQVLIDLFVRKYRLDDVIVADVRYDDLLRGMFLCAYLFILYLNNQEFDIKKERSTSF